MSRPRVRRYFLWNTFQPRFVTVSCCYQVILIAAIAAALFVPLMLQLDRIPLSSEEAKVVADQFLLLHSRFWPAVLVASILLVLHGIFFSHRIAGPLYRFREIFRRVAAGDLTVRTSIRKGDYLQTEAACLGVMVAALREKIESLEANHAEIKPHLERLKQAAERGAMCEVEQETERLRVTVDRFSHSMESFRTKADPDEHHQPQPLPTASGF
ncbi:MAG: methyl-accepting chemotaxis protein [Nitrospiraceae bacterium]|nr:methyl-accepting chemotaxis protein [Nitrospiraceae bacterium]